MPAHISLSSFAQRSSRSGSPADHGLEASYWESAFDTTFGCDATHSSARPVPHLRLVNRSFVLVWGFIGDLFARVRCHFNLIYDRFSGLFLSGTHAIIIHCIGPARGGELWNETDRDGSTSLRPGLPASQTLSLRTLFLFKQTSAVIACLRHHPWYSGGSSRRQGLERARVTAMEALILVAMIGVENVGEGWEV
ncbi:hypothetical protein BJV74DRAFT_894944 [Russula compacta]|nr:hypothetical protein BJV74DRAFT_894944 [Russula compacta]